MPLDYAARCRGNIVRLLALQNLLQAVYEANRDSTWRVVLYQQWIGDINAALAGYSYILEAQAIENPDPKNVSYIEIISNQSYVHSRNQVNAARDVMEMMFQE